jgi:hypothetical protein
MRSYCLAVHKQPGNVRAAAESMLRLLQPMLGNRWRTDDAAASDVVILDAAALDELNRAGATRAGALYVVLEGAGPPPSNAFATIRRPLNSSGLIEVLHMAQAELERRRGGRVEMPAVAPGPGSEAADRRGTDASMRAAVRAVLKDRSAAVSVATAAQAHVLSVLPDVGFATRLDASEIAALVRSDAPVTVRTLSEVQKTLLLRKQRKYYPLKKLEWIYWLAGSDGELRPELDAATPYRLSRWPDFSRLPHFRADVRMASLLKAEALAVGALSERAGVRLETAVHFVNACWSLGLLSRSLAKEPATAAMITDPATSPGGGRRDVAASGGLLRSLRSALGLSERGSRSA